MTSKNNARTGKKRITIEDDELASLISQEVSNAIDSCLGKPNGGKKSTALTEAIAPKNLIQNILRLATLILGMFVVFAAANAKNIWVAILETPQMKARIDQQDTLLTKHTVILEEVKNSQDEMKLDLKGIRTDMEWVKNKIQ